MLRLNILTILEARFSDVMLIMLNFEKQSCLLFHHVISVRHCQASLCCV